MSIESVPNSDQSYHLICYDKHGVERSDDPNAAHELGSELVRAALRDEPITDVFFTSHGWKGDIPAAKRQYGAWIDAMLQCDEDRRRIREVRPGFQPLMVGLHWPSLPWGVEDHEPAGAVDFSTGGDFSVDRFVDEVADGIAETDRAKNAIRAIFDAAQEDNDPAELSDEVVAAFEVLAKEAGRGAAGPAGAPGDDAEAFDPRAAYGNERANEAEAGVSFGGDGLKGGMLGLFRQLSFWKMKKRARTFGESGGADLLRTLQREAAEANRDVRFHLMGHSFGCIAVSSVIAGAGGDSPLVKPVDSAILVQGALSYWSYCSDIPVARRKTGYYHSIIRGKKVRGPLVTTQSEHDTAVGRLYPLAAGSRRQVDFDPGDMPKYGALGEYGARGPGVALTDIDMKPVSESYEFESGRVYNVNGSGFINEGGGMSGAHSDIAKPAVAHTFWEAIIASAKTG